MQKQYHIDTCALLEKGDTIEILRNGNDNEINISMTVINELDNLMKSNKRPKALRAVKNILKNKKYITFTGNKEEIINNDDKILKAIDSGVLVTNDLVLQLKAYIIGIKSEEFKESLPFQSESQKYTGFIDVKEDKLIDNCFYFKDGKLFHYTNKEKKCIDYENAPWKIKPKDVYQNAALELLMNTNIPLKTIQSKAGTGKAQPLYSNILTPNGWKQMGEVEIGDIVFDKNGNTKRMNKRNG